jgi:hypothetical protein
MKAKKAGFPFVNFAIVREYFGRDGQWNPRFKSQPLKGGLQVNVFGRREHYLKLAEFLRKFAERDTSLDGEYHDHFMGLVSIDQRVRLHVILRKDDVGDSCWSNFFPKPALKRRARPRER